VFKYPASLFTQTDSQETPTQRNWKYDTDFAASAEALAKHFKSAIA
jgi:hypothetical protein